MLAKQFTFIYNIKRNHFFLLYYSNNAHQHPHPSLLIRQQQKKKKKKKENIEKLFPSISGWKTMKTFVFGSTSCSLINFFSLFARCCLMVLYEYSAFFFFSLHFDYLSSFHKMSSFSLVITLMLH